MAHEVTRVTRVAQPTAVVAAATTWSAFPALWPALLDEVRAAAVDRRALNVMLYQDDVPNVEVGVLAESSFVPSGRVAASCLPAGDVAMTVHRGLYEDLGVAHRAVIDWCAEQGLARTGVRWEIYGHHEDDPALRVTEVHYLLRGSAVERLETAVDVGVDDDGADASTMSLSASHTAVLVDGRRILLLEGRGWTSTLMRMRMEGAPGDESVRDGASDIWKVTSVEDIEVTARTVVGPDEPFAGQTREEIEAGHWMFLADVLRQQGVAADALELQRLPHDVKLSERLRARLAP